MTAGAGSDARGGIGARLRSAREKKSLTILQTAEKLHVDAKVIESLEAEDFAALGAPVYVRGHLRHYAELVGESASELQQIYSDTIKTVQPDLTRVPKAQPAEDPTRFAGPAVVVLVVFAVAGAVWWVLSLSQGQPPTKGASVAQSAGTSQGGTVDASGSGGVPGAVEEPGGPGPHGAVSVGATGAAAARANASPAGIAPAPSSAGVTPTVAGAPGAAPKVAAAPKPTELTLKFSADSWAEVYDASGARLFYDVGTADTVHTIKGMPPLRVMLGNAPGVVLEINGRAAAITPLVQPDGSARFLINRSGRAVRAKPASDGG